MVVTAAEVLRRVGAVTLGVVALGGVTVACSGGGDDDGATPREDRTSSTSTTSRSSSTYDPGPITDDAGVVPGSHDCVPSRAGGVDIAWSELRNPVYEESAAAKDMTVRWVDGQWHMLFSSRANTDGSMGSVTSRDWSDWRREEPNPDDGGSSDLTRAADDRYVVVHQVDDTATNPIPDSRKIVYRAGKNLERMAGAAPQRIAPGIYDEERLIDGALAHTDWGVYALFKRGLRASVQQVPTLVRSPSGDLDGPWELLGDVESIGWSENYQFLTIDGKWHLLVTSIPSHDPTLYRMEGDPSQPASWREWTLARTFRIPDQRWNTGPFETRGFSHDIANSAFLCDARAVDGHFYLFYAGASELVSNDGRGHQKIGVARSTDLDRWEVPGT